jgi:hypothetical protein
MLSHKTRCPARDIDVQDSRRFSPVASLRKLAAVALARTFTARCSMKSLASVDGLMN